MSLTENQRRAEQAEALSKNSLLKEALESIKAQCYYQIENSDLSKKEFREDCCLMLKACLMFQNELMYYINAGKLDNLNDMDDEINRLMR